MPASIDNKTLVLKAIAALEMGDYEAYLDYLAEDVRFYTIGKTRYSGLVVGREAVWTEILSKSTKSIAETGYREEITRVICEDDVVAVQSRGYEKMTNGSDYNNEYACFYVVKSGKIAEITFYLDTDLLIRSEK